MLEEAIVKHAIGLVENEHDDVGEREAGRVADVVDEAPGCGHEYVGRGSPELALLLAEVESTYSEPHSESRRESTQRLTDFKELDGELACWRKDEGANRAV